MFSDMPRPIVGENLVFPPTIVYDDGILGTNGTQASLTIYPDKHYILTCVSGRSDTTFGVIASIEDNVMNVMKWINAGSTPSNLFYWSISGNTITINMNWTNQYFRLTVFQLD